jgi:hypothetical protein
MAKYKTYKELADAFKSGELKAGKLRPRQPGYFLMLDKGGTENHLSYVPEEDMSDLEAERRQDECGEIFEAPDGVEPILEALGIPWDWC